MKMEAGIRAAAGYLFQSSSGVVSSSFYQKKPIAYCIQRKAAKAVAAGYLNPIHFQTKSYRLMATG
jgi:hypothetical protein